MTSCQNTGRTAAEIRAVRDIPAVSVQFSSGKEFTMNESSAYMDDRWEEMIGGRIVMMSPASMNHNRVHGIFTE